MNKLIDALTQTLGLLFGLFFIFATFFGVYHGFKKHDTATGFIAAFVPPYAWYLTAEGLIWHDDFNGVDWDVRIKNDTRSALYLIGAASSIDEKNLLQYQEALEGFTMHIKDYPEEQKKRIEDAATTFIRYSMSTMGDMGQALNYAIDHGTKPEFTMSGRTKAIGEELAAFDGTEELIKDASLSYKALGEMYGDKQAADLSEEQRSKMRSMLALMTEKEVNARISRFKDIFGHEPDINTVPQYQSFP